MFEDGFKISDVTVSTPYGNIQKIYGNALRGLNRNPILDTRESARDQVGFTFFVRPMLNLSTANLNRWRPMHKYLVDTSKFPNHVDTSSRIMLDRLLAFSENLSSETADNLSAFIPILSNNLLDLTGFLDPTVDSYVSPSGARKQQYNLLDGTDEINETMDLTGTFKNTYEDGVVSLLSLWFMYMPRVKEGILNPYLGFIARRMVDYHSRIFRLVMTEDKRHVKRIGATGPIYPDVNAMGKYFDVSNGTTYNAQTATHQVRFKCMGVEYNDPILIREFNRTVGFFNPMMRGINEGKSAESVGLVKLSPRGEQQIEFKGYPRINEGTNELEWYVEGRIEKN